MTRALTACAALAATLAIAACGGGGDDSSSTPAGSGSPSTVAVQRVDGVGSVLVDPTGKALYTPDEEADGKVRCTGGCTDIWQPLLAPDSGAPMADGDAGALDVIARPDGTRQVTAGGKPLYTFSEDGPGEVTGDGFKDAFDGRDFTWHAVLAGGEVSSGSGASGSNDDAGTSRGNDYGY
jgi:predicted lipoprotein with Yx(FWY)xxD motif